MANREALRELQSRLAARLQSSQDATRTAQWLAVECGGQGFLLGLADAGEIFPLAALKPVPHTHGWFAGVANLRGGLHGVVDLAAFLGLRGPALPESVREHARLVALNPAHGAQCALLIERLAGLRLPDQLEQVESGDPATRPAFAGPVWRDAEGRAWQELDLAALARHEQFLGIAA
ncbi:MAG: chemotaxis protein CheW [Betaproteobacteria bacterium]|jgi:twitching motility protein PilI|nr:chemotaxis protein CheW [Betaproteobacteria bacterium]MCC6247667.1 chemotaxis protein CheW [Rubrivivax sp.]MCL4696827.1 chemotaxis protein CheW [Burkholderiaceae bacterium]